MSARRAEQLATLLMEQDRDGLIQILRSVRCGFRLDFTDDYLRGLPLDRLRHVVLAACLRAEQHAR